MRLNIPVLDKLSRCQNILIAGMGGGFDVFCGLPLYFELRESGFNVHLANYTHASLHRLKGARRLTPTLIGVRAETDSLSPYFPELHLARWFKEQRQEDVTIWCYERCGVKPMVKHFEVLISYLSIDAILLVDGGVDSLIRGDETEWGSPIEDIATIAAVSTLDNVPVRIVTCVGLGAEREISYAQIFENMAALTASGGFLGSCSLVKELPAAQYYQSALLYAQEQPRQDASVINSSIVSALQGQYGDYHLTEKTQGSQLWISPLMPIYWFFDLLTVAKQSLLVSHLLASENFEDVARIIQEVRISTATRETSPIDLI